MSAVSYNLQVGPYRLPNGKWSTHGCVVQEVDGVKRYFPYSSADQWDFEWVAIGNSMLLGSQFARTL